ncbi:DUF2304 domain-containing protein [Cellulosimicrobium cellulans]|uniref:DUF2304 domain-containing protein n=1 Tax=Cellulosimicrobium cellulans TaxID=1710 RepID=UPI002149A2DF|nr:DUF2304 domain-containing protein [Cellulosimicrobium cellulans]
MTAYLFAALVAVVLVVSMLFLLRRRRVSEKYAGIWIVLALAVVVLVVFPGLSFAVARIVGVATPINLVFVLGLVVLLLVCIQLSVSLTAIEDRNRTLTEEIALLRHEVGELRERTDAVAGDRAGDSPEEG